MPLSGELDVIELGQVFQMLSSGQKEGRLILERDGERKELFFTPCGVTLQIDEAKTRDQMYRLLRNLRHIPEEVIQAASSQVEQDGADPINVLVMMGILDPKDVDQAYWRLMAEEMYQLFEWKQGKFEFVEERLHSSAVSTSSPIPGFLRCDSVLMEAARRMDEWQEIRKQIPGRDVVLALVDSHSERKSVHLEEGQVSVLPWIDGVRSVRDVIEKTGGIAFDVEKQLAQWVREGWVRLLTPEEFSAAGSQAFDLGRYEKAAHLFELAIRHEQDLPDSIGAAARAREALKDIPMAVSHFRNFAAKLQELGESEAALQALTQALNLAPKDPETKESLVRFLLQTQSDAPTGFDLHQEIQVLAKQWIEWKDFERCDAFLKEVMESMGDVPELKLLQATVFHETGRIQEAIDVYRDLAKDAEQRNDPQEALRHLQHALYLRPESRGIQDKIDFLKKGEQKKKRLKQGAILWASVTGVCLVVAAGFFWRESGARTELARLGLKAEEFAAKGNYDGAISLYQDFKEEYPYSFVGSEIEVHLEKLRKQKHDAEEKQKTVKVNEEQKRTRQLFLAEKYLKEADKASESGKLADALQLMVKALEEAPSDWERRGRVLREVSDLEEYAQRANELMKQSQDQEKQGDLVAARKNLRILLDRYPHAPIAEKVQIPFRVETLPPGAVVSWEGKKLNGRTPLVVQLPPHANGKLMIEREGFASQTLNFSGEANEEIRAVLTRVPDRVVPIDGLAVTEPAISANRLYFGLSGGKLTACELETGKSIWNFSIRGFGEITTTPLPAGDLVFFGASDLRLYAVNLWGDERWRVSLDKATRNTPLLVKNTLYVVTESGQITALEAQTGREVWSESLGSASLAPLIARGDWIIAGDVKGMLHVLDAESGDGIKNFSFGTAIYSILPVGEDRFLVVGEDGRLAMRQLSQETPLWEKKGSGLLEIHPIVRNNKVFLAEGKNLVQIDAETGNQLETIELPSPLARGLRYGAGALYGKDLEGYWIAVEPASNFIRWRAKLPSQEVAFEVDPRRVWVLGKDKNLYLFDEAAAQFSSLIGR